MAINKAVKMLTLSCVAIPLWGTGCAKPPDDSAPALAAPRLSLAPTAGPTAFPTPYMSPTPMLAPVLPLGVRHVPEPIKKKRVTRATFVSATQPFQSAIGAPTTAGQQTGAQGAPGQSPQPAATEEARSSMTTLTRNLIDEIERSESVGDLAQVWLAIDSTIDDIRARIRSGRADWSRGARTIMLLERLQYVIEHKQKILEGSSVPHIHRSIIDTNVDYALTLARQLDN